MKTLHGNSRETVIDNTFIETGDYEQIVKTALTLNGLIREGAEIKRGEKALTVKSFGEALDWLIGQAKDGMYVQRYKGLEDESGTTVGDNHGSQSSHFASRAN